MRRRTRNIYCCNHLCSFDNFMPFCTYYSYSKTRTKGTGQIRSFSSMFSKNFTTPKKWSLAFSFTGYIVYTAANFYPEFYTLIPAAIYLGFCAAPLWSSQCQYLTVSAEKLSKVAGKTTESWVNRMFGTFFFVFQERL